MNFYTKKLENNVGKAIGIFKYRQFQFYFRL